ncbi:unnamed protein product, partial [Aureobasidium pullulans]
ANPKLAKLRDDDDRLPIHWATSYNRLPIVEILSERKDFDPDVQVRDPIVLPTFPKGREGTRSDKTHIKDGAGWTPLMIASSLKEADPSSTSSSPNPPTPPSLKIEPRYSQKLIANKASARVKDKRGQLPLHRAAAVGSVPMVKLLLENRSPVNGSDGDGCTALHHAVAEGHGDTAVVLLKAGAETDKRDNSGALALDLAPDAKVRSYITRAAEEEGIAL